MMPANAQAADAVGNTPPSIGAPWRGGLYAGLVHGADGEPDQHVVLHADAKAEGVDWEQATEWAANLGDGWSLPTRDELALLYASLREVIGSEGWYWTSTQYSRFGAWVQYFGNGNQDGSDNKSWSGGRARAVRRFGVQSFIPSSSQASVQPAPRADRDPFTLDQVAGAVAFHPSFPADVSAAQVRQLAELILRGVLGGNCTVTGRAVEVALGGTVVLTCSVRQAA